MLQLVTKVKRHEVLESSLIPRRPSLNGDSIRKRRMVTVSPTVLGFQGPSSLAPACVVTTRGCVWQCPEGRASELQPRAPS